MMRSGGGLRALFRSGGSGKLYSGIWGNLAGVGPATALFFGVYEPVKAEASKIIGVDAAPLIAGGIAGVASSIIRVPTEVVKQRMQTGQFATALGAVSIPPSIDRCVNWRWQVSKIARTEGLRGFFAGYDAFLLRDLPFDAIEFATYEALKSFYLGMTHRRRLNTMEAAVTGAIAGGFTGETFVLVSAAISRWRYRIGDDAF